MKISLLDTDSKVAVVSNTPADPENNNSLLVTYRLIDNTNTYTIEIKLLTNEGVHGELTVSIIPSNNPMIC